MEECFKSNNNNNNLSPLPLRQGSILFLTNLRPKYYIYELSKNVQAC